MKPARSPGYALHADNSPDRTRKTSYVRFGLCKNVYSWSFTVARDRTIGRCLIRLDADSKLVPGHLVAAQMSVVQLCHVGEVLAIDE